MAKDIVNLDGVMNLAEAMGNLDGDAELLQEIVTLFVQTGPAQLATLAGAVEAGAVKDVAIQAHGLKGAASNFCARKFVASAFALENLAKGGTLAGAGALLAAMRENLAELAELVALINWDEVAQNWSR